MASCEFCGRALSTGAPTVRLEARVGIGSGRRDESMAARAPIAPPYLCAEHAAELADGEPAAGAVAAADAALRGGLYQELDLLAFALEMECAEALSAGREAEAARAQQTRLGVRLAQRLVGNVTAPEVSERLDRWRAAYDSKLPQGSPDDRAPARA